MKRILFFLALVLSAPVFAQSSPGLVFGQVPTAAQWNSYFAAKQNYFPGGLPVANGGTGATDAATARLNLGISSPADLATALPNAAVSKLYGGSGSAGQASVVNVGSGLTLSGGTLTASGGTGTVTSFSMASANGFVGGVSNATTTPLLTVSTNVTGILQGNGTAISAATTSGSGAVALVNGATLIAPALGTPVSGVATNLTGTAAGLTAGHVTTNANLTGPVTSTGNATNVAQTGTGSTFVMNTAPTVSNLTATGTTTLAASLTGVLKAASGVVAIAANTDLPTMTSTVGGAVPTPPNSALVYLDGTGHFSAPAGNGIVSTVSIASANGFAGSSSGGSTPALTLSTTANGILQGNGTAISAATTTGSGATVALQTSPSFITPALGVASATSLATSTITSSGAMSLIPAAGSNLNVSLSGAGDLAVNTNQLYVDTSAAAVGIGTATPATKFHVVGGRSTFAASSETLAVGARYVNTGGTVFFGAASSSGTPDAVISNNGGTALMTLQNGGNVGIGTTSPSTNLHNYGSVNSSISTLTENASVGASAVASNSVKSNNGSLVAQIGSTASGGTGSLYYTGTGSMDIYTVSNTPLFLGTNNNATVVTVGTNSFVGIGTTSPTAALTIYSTASALAGGIRLGFDSSDDYTISRNTGSGALEFVGSQGAPFTAYSFDGAVNAHSSLVVAGAVTAQAALSVTGATTLSSTLGVSGATTTAGITNTGAISTGTLAATGNATVGGTLGITGATTAAAMSVTTLTSSSTASIGGALTVSSGSAKVSKSDATTPVIYLQNSTTGFTTTDGFQLYTSAGDAYVANAEAGALNFLTNNALRGSFSSSGLFSTTGGITATGTVTASNFVGAVPIASLGLGGGTPSSGTFLRGDNQWAAVPGGTVNSVVVPTNNGLKGTVTGSSALTIALGLDGALSAGLLKGSGSSGIISTATAGTDYPGLASANAYSGLNALNGPYAAITPPLTVSASAVSRTAPTGGGSGGTDVASGFFVGTTVSSGTPRYEWNQLNRVSNSSTSTDAAENVGFYSQAFKNSTGGTWGGVFESHDTTHTANPTTPLYALELDVSANGTDSNNTRFGMQIVGYRDNPSGAVNHIANGIWMGSNFGDPTGTVFDTAINVQANGTTGLLLGGAYSGSTISVNSNGVNAIPSLIDASGAGNIGAILHIAAANTVWVGGGSMGAYAGKIKINIDGTTFYIPVTN